MSLEVPAANSKSSLNPWAAPRDTPNPFSNPAINPSILNKVVPIAVNIVAGSVKASLKFPKDFPRTLEAIDPRLVSSIPFASSLLFAAFLFNDFASSSLPAAVAALAFCSKRTASFINDVCSTNASLAAFLTSSISSTRNTLFKPGSLPRPSTILLVRPIFLLRSFSLCIALFIWVVKISYSSLLLPITLL